MRELRPHHQATVDALTEKLKADADVIALLISGSIAKGWESENSDVDFVMVKTDVAYQAHAAKGEFVYFDHAIATYEGGYVDGKIIDVQFLRDVAHHGSEVARSAFLGVWIVYSHDPEVAQLLEKILTYPEESREAKLKSFYSQIKLWNWYVSEAEKRKDKYLLLQATTEVVLFASRLMLAYNRVFYPYHKWMRRQLETLKELPENFFPLMDAFLENPNTKTSEAFVNCVLDYRDWGVSFPEAVSQFLLDREWNWREGKPSIHDW